MWSGLSDPIGHSGTFSDTFLGHSRKLSYTLGISLTLSDTFGHSSGRECPCVPEVLGHLDTLIVDNLGHSASLSDTLLEYSSGTHLNTLGHSSGKLLNTLVTRMVIVSLVFDNKIYLKKSNLKVLFSLEAIRAQGSSLWDGL